MAARSRAASEKHTPEKAQRRPRQRSAPTAISDQTASGGSTSEPGAVAGLGGIDPVAHRLEGERVLPAREELPAEQGEALQPLAAQVVLAALEHRDPELA